MSDEQCPFCGYVSIFFCLDQSQGLKWGSVVCGNCGAEGPEVRTNYKNSASEPWHEQALKEWNTRK